MRDGVCLTACKIFSWIVKRVCMICCVFNCFWCLWVSYVYYLDTCVDGLFGDVCWISVVWLCTVTWFWVCMLVFFLMIND